MALENDANFWTILPRLDNADSKDCGSHDRESRKSTWNGLSNACYDYEIPLIFTGLSFFFVYYVITDPIYTWTVGAVFLAMEIRVWITRFKSFQREFLYFWKRQLKMIILTCSAITILVTDIYWAYVTKSWKTVIGTISVNTVIHFYIQADLAEVTLLLRIIVPSVLMIFGIFEYYMMLFVLQDIDILMYKGEQHTLFGIQCFAWSQVLIFSFLGFKAIVIDRKREKFYLIEKNLKRGPDYKTGGWMFSLTDMLIIVTCGAYIATSYLNMSLSCQLLWGGLFLVFSIAYIRDVKLKPVFFLEYRPVLLVFSSLTILVCQIVRAYLNPEIKTTVEYVKTIFARVVYVYATLMALLSDFHTEPTKSFRLFLPLGVFIQGCVSLFSVLFLMDDYVLFQGDGYKIRINEFERNGHMQILLLLFANFISLVSDPSHKKFFLISRLRNRRETRNYMICRCIFPDREVSLLAGDPEPAENIDPTGIQIT